MRTTRDSSLLGLLMALLVAVGGCATHQEPAEDHSPVDQYLAAEDHDAGKRIDVDLDGVDLAVAMQQISQQVGHEIRVSPDVHETLRVSLRDIPWREAVAVIARMSRCEVVEQDGALLLRYPVCFVTVQFTDADVRTVLQLLAAYEGKEIELPADLQGKIDVDLVVSEGAIQAVLDQVGGYRLVEDEGDVLRVVAETADRR